MRIRVFGTLAVLATAVFFTSPGPPAAPAQQPVAPAQAVPFQKGINAKTGKPFPRGATRSPGHKIASAPRHLLAASPPPQFAMIPSQIHMWGNDQYGDCVSAQEACSMAAWTTYCGQPVIPSDAEVIAFARKHGLLNGANLDQVMDIMTRDGMSVGGKVYKDGGYSSVDYSVPVVFQSALTVGPVNVAIDANALPGGAGNKQGWYAFGGRPGEFGNTDHCITFLAYGPASFCFEAIHCPLPAGVDANKACYVCDTWNTLGVVDQGWVMSTMEEAWVRNPTTVGFSPPAPNPTPTPTPPPVPPPGPGPTPTPGTGFTGSITTTYANGVVTNITTGGAPGGTLEAELKGAGVSPNIIVDLLKLVADVKAKAGFAVLLADMMAIIMDLKANEPAPPQKQSAVARPEFLLAA